MRALLDPGSLRKVKSTQGMSGTDFYQSVIQATWMNNTKKPMDDPRVRRAFHLVLDKPVLVDVVKDIAPMMVGGFIYPFSSFATPLPELSKRLGYQADPTASIKEAKALMKAAGYEKGIQGLDYLVREVASFKLWSQAIQAMLQQTLNVADQHPHRRGIGVVRRRAHRQVRPGDRRHRVDADRSQRLLQRLVQEGRAAELLAMGQSRSSMRCCRGSTARSIPRSAWN